MPFEPSWLKIFLQSRKTTVISPDDLPFDLLSSVSSKPTLYPLGDINGDVICLLHLTWASFDTDADPWYAVLVPPEPSPLQYNEYSGG